MLEGAALSLLELLKRLDSDLDLTYDTLVAEQRTAVESAQKQLDDLLALEGLCDATTLRTPTGRKRRRDRGTKRVRRKNGGFVAVDDIQEGDLVALTPEDHSELCDCAQVMSPAEA